MPSTAKKSTGNKISAKISRKVKDRGNDPYFIKKAADSKAFLEKNGFPEELIARKS